MRDPYRCRRNASVRSGQSGHEQDHLWRLAWIRSDRQGVRAVLAERLLQCSSEQQRARCESSAAEFGEGGRLLQETQIAVAADRDKECCELTGSSHEDERLFGRWVVRRGRPAGGISCSCANSSGAWYCVKPFWYDQGLLI